MITEQPKIEPRVEQIPTLPPPSSTSLIDWVCCSTYKDRYEIHNVLLQLDLSIVEKQIILSRYVHLMDHLSKRVKMYSRVFYMGHIVITVGSLFVPALLSIQNSNPTYTTGGSSFTVQIYWATFIISLLVTTCNGILTLFKIDKKYYFLNTTLERLRTEGWQYLGLTGRYSGLLTGNDEPTHKNQFVFFTHQIEKIKMKQVEEEYYKSDENSTHLPNGTNNTTKTTNELHPLSPDRPITEMASGTLPDPVKDAVQSILQSQSAIHTDGDSNGLTNIVVVPPLSRKPTVTFRANL